MKCDNCHVEHTICVPVWLEVPRNFKIAERCYCKECFKIWLEGRILIEA